MPKPLLEEISDVVVARLQQIVAADGYEFDIASVTIVDRDLNQWPRAPLTIVIEYGEQEPMPELNCTGNPPATAFKMPFEIYGYARQHNVDDSEPGVVDTGVTDTQMQAAIIKALADVDSGDWANMGGKAIDSKVASIDSFDAAGFDGGKVTLEVCYRTNENDPFTQR